MRPERDTIFALSTAPGRAGVAVIRISGPMAAEAAKLFQAPLPKARRAVFRTLFDIATEERIDSALVLWFPAPHSFTGENTMELQCHGGRAVVDAVLGAVQRIDGFRPAEPGEFTRRAVENGRLDLTQAEALADLIDAETDAQRRQALQQYDGALSALYEGWRSRLIRAAAWLEAAIDFPDEEIPEGALEASCDELATIRSAIAVHLKDGRRGEILREGLQVAVIGAPNAGKSSLVNALARRDVAIVSEMPGTTRDVIEVRLDLRGYPVILADTAGLRETDDAVEREGVRRAKERADNADVRLLVVDGMAPDSVPTRDDADIIAFSKADLVTARPPGHWFSATTGEGIDALVDLIAGKAETSLKGDTPVLTRARHRHALDEAELSLSRALMQPPGEVDLAAEDVRRALNAIGRITGRVDLDELLDVVFRDFCIGK